MDPLNCKRVKVDLYDPFKQIEDEKKKLPGPGSYYKNKEDQPHKERRRVKRYNNKIDGKQVIVMSQKKMQRQQEMTPGPGSYIEPLDKNKYSVAPVTNSMFKSDSLRDIYNLSASRVPGPAFYKIQNKNPKRSFNYNPKRKWL